MPCHHNCDCKHCSTTIYKRTKVYLPQPQPQPSKQTTRALNISASDIFPVLKFPSIVRKIMSPLIRIEKVENTKEYGRGWNYVEPRHGRLYMVRNKRDGFDIHRGGWIKSKPRKKVVGELVLMEPENEPMRRGRSPRPAKANKVFIDVHAPRHHRQESPDSDEPLATPRPRVQVRRPVNAPPSPVFESHKLRPRHLYTDPADRGLVRKVTAEKVRLTPLKPVQVVEEDPGCEEDVYDYGDCFDEVHIPVRESTPYHIPEPENSYWDDDLQAWLICRKPRVRFDWGDN